MRLIHIRRLGERFGIEGQSVVEFSVTGHFLPLLHEIGWTAGHRGWRCGGLLGSAEAGEQAQNEEGTKHSCSKHEILQYGASDYAMDAGFASGHLFRTRDKCIFLIISAAADPRLQKRRTAPRTRRTW